MQVIPKDAPASVPGQISEHQKAASKREAAIAAFVGNKGQKDPTPVQDPSKISPEELSVVSKGSETPVDPEFQRALEAARTPKDGQTQDSEATVEATPAKPKEEPLSAQYAQLARKEKALRAMARDLKAQQDALKSAQAPVKPPQEQIDPNKYISIEEFQKNPWKYVQQANVTYDQLTQEALNQPSPEQQAYTRQIAALEAKLTALEDGQKASQKNWEDNQQQQYKQAVNQIRSEVTQLVKTDSNYEAISATDSIGDVVELIERTFKEDGTLLSVEEAAQQVEEYLVEEATKLAKLKKIQSKLKPAESVQSATNTKQEQPKQQQTGPNKTLSNAMTSTRQLSAKERALAAAQYGPSWRDKI